MVGMIQILTYLLAFYLVMKGVEILQIGMASSREDRNGPIRIGVLSLIICIGAAALFVGMQDEQARKVNQTSQPTGLVPGFPSSRPTRHLPGQGFPSP